MPSIARKFPFVFVLVLSVVGVPVTQAQTLSEPNPVRHVLNVVQFGVLRDAQFVFCDDVDCPKHSIKHLYVVPQPLPPLPNVVLVPLPMSIPELSPAKVDQSKSVKKVEKRRRHKKSKIRHECDPRHLSK